MNNMEEKIAHYQSFLGMLSQDRDQFAGHAFEANDVEVSKAWVRQLDAVISVLSGLIDDWKEVGSSTSEMLSASSSLDGFLE